MRVVGVMGVVIPVRKIDILCSDHCRIMQNERNITGIILFLQSRIHNVSFSCLRRKSQIDQ